MESEVNVKGVSLKELLKVYTESDVSQKAPEQSETNKVWEKVWARLDKKGRDLTNGGAQNKKAKGKTSLKGKVGIENVSEASKQRTSNNLKSKSKGNNENTR